MDKVTRQCPQTTTFLKRQESRSGIEPRSFRLPAQRLTARPSRLTTCRNGARLLRLVQTPGLDDVSQPQGQEVDVQANYSVMCECSKRTRQVSWVSGKIGCRVVSGWRGYRRVSGKRGQCLQRRLALTRQLGKSDFNGTKARVTLMEPRQE